MKQLFGLAIAVFLIGLQMGMIAFADEENTEYTDPQYAESVSESESEVKAETEAVVETEAVAAVDETEMQEDEVELMVLTGWQTINGAKYYYSSSGVPFKGVKKIGSYYYYFDNSGKMVTSTYKKVEQGGETYYLYLNSKGRCSTGIKKIPGKDYSFYFYGDGKIASNKLVAVDDNYYFFGTSGVMVTSAFKTVGSYIYYFGSNGAAYKGWNTINGSTYYFNSKGRAFTGIRTIGSYTYMFTDGGKMITNTYKKVVEGSTTKYYYFNSKGRCTTGIKQIPGKDYSFYFNGDGTIVTSAFKTVSGKLYFFTKDGILCKANWRNAGTADLNSKPLYIHCDPVTGEVAQGKTTFVRESDNAECTYYFDHLADNGYRTGMIEADGATYWFSKKNNTGYLEKGFYVDFANRKVYFFDYKTGKLKKSGTVAIPDTNIVFNINKDGTVNVASGTKVTDSDSNVDKLIKYAFSELYKPAGHPLYTSELMTPPLAEVPYYNCSGFVMRMYKEVNDTDGVWQDTDDIFQKNNDLILYVKKNGTLVADMSKAKTGDIVFYNLDNCGSTKDDLGDLWIIDQDNNGICDRIHKDIKVGSKTAHVHHEGIYIGNGQVIHAAINQGITIATIDLQNREEFYTIGYGRVF